MVETTSLENWYSRKAIEGSNPSLSAQLRSVKNCGTSLSSSINWGYLKINAKHPCVCMLRIGKNNP